MFKKLYTNQIPKTNGILKNNFELSNLTWFKVGGIAEVFFVPRDLKDLISSLDKKQGPYLFVTHYVVIGSYTNIFPVSGGIVVHDLNSQVNNELQLF